MFGLSIGKQVKPRERYRSGGGAELPYVFTGHYTAFRATRGAVHDHVELSLVPARRRNSRYGKHRAQPSRGEKLEVGRVLGYALILWLGVILSATMTPSISGLADPDRVMAWCDLSRIGPPPFDQLRTLNDVGLNVFLFVPLGLLVSAVARHRWKTLICAAARSHF